MIALARLHVAALLLRIAAGCSALARKMLLGTAPRWTAAIAAGLLPSLVGHLLYGAGLGVAFHLLEARYSPWWIPHTHLEAAAAAHRREQVLTSAPALWARPANDQAAC